MTTLQLDDAKIDGSSITNGLSSNDSNATSSNEKEINDATTQEGIFIEVLNKLQNLKERAATSTRLKKSTLVDFQHILVELINVIEENKKDDNEEQRLDKTVLVEWYHILVELVNVIEDSKSDITKQNYFAVRKQTKSLSVTINTSKTWLQDDDTTYAHEIVDLYFNFFKLQHIKNYLTSNTDISDAVKLLYENCILSNVSRILEGAFNSVVYASSFTVEDLKQLIVYNEILIRHEDGIKVLNALDLMSVLKEIRITIKKSDSYFRETVEILCMTLALLSTPEQIKNDRKQMNIVLDDIFDTLVLSARAQDYRYQHRFHVSEPLVVLVKLFSYDRTLDYIMQHAEVEQLETATTLEFLLDFFFKYYATVKYNDPLKLTTMTALCNIFWSVSLQPQYKQELYEDKKKFEEFKKLIQQIAYGKDNKMIVTTPTHYVPTYIENIRKAANGILCNIVEQQQSETQKSEQYGVKKLRAVAFPLKSSSIDSPSIPKPSIMISYSHGDNDVCTQLYNELNKRNNEFDIWIDRQCCKTGYLWGKIADGIQEASVILCLLSNKYYESKSCQQEFVYANDHLKKQIIPVFIQNDKPPGCYSYMFAKICSISSNSTIGERKVKRFNGNDRRIFIIEQ
ncbi:unnamed protein product [Rotaria sordida]|uniref:TIR domain-containing protein n=1 Tax=Rotaria sordida TaxID=392033 RepID=A0A819MKD1_9BILA|nr:unnamed protein product [Rotaria sordida]